MGVNPQSGFPSSLSPGRHLLQGAIFVSVAEALLPLTGIITASFLTRKLGAANYGLLTICGGFIGWAEFAVTSFFTRASIKFIAEAEDWSAASTAVLRSYSLASFGVMVFCWIISIPLAGFLGDQRIAGYLALFALDIPTDGIAYCHCNILTGKSLYLQRAASGAARWITRLLLIILLVEFGLSVSGAILATIGASAAELLIARLYVRPSWSSPKPQRMPVYHYALPIFAGSMALQILRLDLLLVKSLGGTMAEAGFYGSAQNIAYVLPGLAFGALSPLLLSTMTQMLRNKDALAARNLGRQTVRGVVGLLPFVVLGATSSYEIVGLLFGRGFLKAAPLVSILLFAGLALTMIHMLSAVLVAYGKPLWTLILSAPLIPMAITGQVFVIPRFGAMGAAIVTTSVTCLGAMAVALITLRRFKIAPPMGTLARSLFLCSVSFAAAHYWSADGALIPVKLTVIFLLLIGGFFLLGELHAEEIEMLGSIMRRSFHPRGSSTESDSATQPSHSTLK